MSMKVVYGSSSLSSRRGSMTLLMLLFVSVMLFSMTKAVSATKPNIRGTKLNEANYDDEKEEENCNNNDNGVDNNKKGEERRRNCRTLLEHLRENPASMEYVKVGTRDSDPSSSSHHHNNKKDSNASASSTTNTAARSQPHNMGKRFLGIERVDHMGITHTRFEETMNDIPIFGQEQIIHHAQGALQDRITETVMDPKIQEMLKNLDMEPTLSMEDAIDAAKAYLQGQQEEGSVISILDGTVLNVLPMAEELMVYLTYKVPTKIEDSQGNMVGKPYVFVNAHSSPADGDASIVKVLETLSTVLLKDANKVTKYHKKGRLSDGEKRFPVGDSSDPVLDDLHRFVQYTLDFLATPLVQFDLYDDQGAKVRAIGHYGRNYVNAFWDGKKIAFGDGDGIEEGPQGVLDVVAHEIGHAVTEFSSGLIYENESGALDEAAADILGAAVETFVMGGQITEKTWLFGEDSAIEGFAGQYMDRPSDDGYSRDHYSNRFTGRGDSGGVHSNSGIVNHWFYLLVVGGQHHNPRFQSGTIVNGIGMDTAFDIWFEAWTSELTPTSNMHDARDATILACEELGYDVNTICVSVEDAWKEVGVV